MKVGLDYLPAVAHAPGVGRYVRNLVRHMVEQGTDDRFVLFVDREGEEESMPLDRSNVSHRTLTLPALQNYFTWLQLRLPPSLWRRPVDLFHFPFYTMPLLSIGPAVVTGLADTGIMTNYQASARSPYPSSLPETFERLGIPQQERAFLAGVEAQYDWA